MTALILIIALAAGLIFRQFGFPPLLGYLAAGFAANYFGLGDVETIRQLADIGITLLLFTIGLKLNLKELMQIQVWGTASIHMVFVCVVTVPVVFGMTGWFPSLAVDSLVAIWVLAFALTFSSTVFAVKIFEQRGDTTSLHAAIAIGILIIQDLFAVGFLVFAGGQIPSVWALGLLALPVLRPLLIRILDRTGYGELLVLFGVAAALGAYELFELVNLKGDLGALLLGVMMGQSHKSKELYKNLISLKDLFLIGFFLQIGFYQDLSLQMVLAAAILSLLIFLRPVIYYLLLTGFGLRARTSFLTSMALFNYSEFGLIVGAIAVSAGLLEPQWLPTLALALAISFFIATPVNTRVHEIYGRISDFLKRVENIRRLKRDQYAMLGEAEYVVLGMGRVGRGVYDILTQHYGDRVIGVEEDLDRANQLRDDGIQCIHADATDYEFWIDADLARRRVIFVNFSNHHENLQVVELANRLHYDGQLAVISRYPDHKSELERLGCITFNLYAEAGHGFAQHVLQDLKKRQSDPV